MKKKSIWIILIIIMNVLGMTGYYIYHKVQEKKEQNEILEYTPEPEITEEQLRQTIVSLYFNHKDTGTLVPEARSIDVKILANDPYMTLMNLLISGPKNDTLKSTIPEGTKINQAKLQSNMLILDLSKEFIDNHVGGTQEESTTIYSIVNTMTQLNEIESVKIIIDGQENLEFKDREISFKEPFVRKD